MIQGWEGDDWLRGKLNGQHGIFPITFVEIVEDVQRPGDEAAGEELVNMRGAAAGSGECMS